ncbi:MAG: IPT/TIG domain-containing protein, partial [Bdellovibrionales bacterium]|nr:IPT/TIG domain-containing protein [Bdellovibrionales bacterium]
VSLTIADSNNPPETLTDDTDLDVYPITAVGGVLAGYFDTGTTPPAQVVATLANTTLNHVEVRPDMKVVSSPTGTIGGSSLTNNTVVTLVGSIAIPAAGSYQFSLNGGSATWLRIDSMSGVTGPVQLTAGSHSIEARFAVDSVSQLPLSVLVSFNGSSPTPVPAALLSHDQTALPPFINSMPVQGSEFGGEHIVIDGVGFFPASSVVLNWGTQSFVAPTIQYGTQILFTVPPGTGQVPVSVTTPNGTSNQITYTYQSGTVPIQFSSAVATTTPGETFSRAAWGPDGRLYVGGTTGNIYAYTLDENYAVTATQTISAIAPLQNNAILGLAFNPYDSYNPPAQPLKLYVSHSQLFAQGGGCFSGPAPYTGQVSVLSGPNFSTVTPLITGLPSSNHDHGVNGLQFDNFGDLYIAIGGNTNAGVHACALGDIPESPLAGGIAKAFVSKPSFNGTVTYLETATGLPNNDQVFGETVDIAPGVDVVPYFPGFRNPFDVLLTTRNFWFASENGADIGFGDASTSLTTQAPITQDADDELDLLASGHHYGHANRNLGRYDARRAVYFYPTDSPVHSVYTAPLAVVASSSNGLEEYRSQAFNSQIKGSLLLQKWQGELYNLILSSDSRSVSQVNVLFQDPSGLDVIMGPGGAVLTVGFDAAYTGNVTVHTPIDPSVVGPTAMDIFPWRAPAAGGAPFVIGGQNFGSLASTSVTFGTVPATVTSVSSKRITGTIPAPSAPTAELLDVVVQTGGQQTTLEKAFRYLLPDGVGVGEWTVETPMPHELGEVAAGIVNGVMYIVGHHTNQTLSFDLSTGLWRDDHAVRPFIGDHHAAEVVDGKWYLIGGIGGSSDLKVQIYDPLTDSWSTGQDIPFSSGSGSTAVIDGKIYLAGGLDSTQNQETANTAVYNPVSNSWTMLTPMLAGRHHAASATDGQKLYVFGGRVGPNVPTLGQDSVQIYDPVTDAWVASFQSGSGIPPLPQRRSGMGKAVYYRGELYVLGGETVPGGIGAEPGDVYDRVDVYNPVSASWRQEVDMPTARHGIFPLLHDDKIYVAGGGDMAGHSESDAVEVFHR